MRFGVVWYCIPPQWHHTKPAAGQEGTTEDSSSFSFAHRYPSPSQNCNYLLACMRERRGGALLLCLLSYMGLVVPYCLDSPALVAPGEFKVNAAAWMKAQVIGEDSVLDHLLGSWAVRKDSLLSSSMSVSFSVLSPYLFKNIRHEIFNTYKHPGALILSARREQAKAGSLIFSDNCMYITRSMARSMISYALANRPVYRSEKSY